MYISLNRTHTKLLWITEENIFLTVRNFGQDYFIHYVLIQNVMKMLKCKYNNIYWSQTYIKLYTCRSFVDWTTNVFSVVVVVVVVAHSAITEAMTWQWHCCQKLNNNLFQNSWMFYHFTPKLHMCLDSVRKSLEGPLQKRCWWFDGCKLKHISGHNTSYRSLCGWSFTTSVDGCIVHFLWRKTVAC